MLSYQHSYHAGNMADVHKHALLAWVLDYLTRKDKPLSYIETHAGRGLYDLTAAEALKTGEAAQGINRAEGWFAKDHPYLRILSETRAVFGPDAYPGSPLIATLALRAGDSLQLAELHPQENAALRGNLAMYSAKVHDTDGFAMAQAICPPTPRRGLMLIDPSFEVKADYDAMPRFIQTIHRKWNVGTIILWYPVLTSGAHRVMVADLENMELKDSFRHEVTFGPARDGHRMTGSGLFVVNAPYGMQDEAKRLSKMFAKA